MKILTVKENSSDKGFITPEELFVENKKELQCISEQIEEQNKSNEKTLKLFNNLESAINELKKETNSKIENIEKVLKVKDTILKEYKSNFKNSEKVEAEINTKIEEINNYISTEIKKITANFKKEIKAITISLKEIKEYFKKELKRVEDKHVVKMDTQPKKIYGLSNVTAPSMIEKTITPGTIRYDKDTDTYRVCKKSGWKTLKL